jgi:hypothetical protein
MQQVPLFDKRGNFCLPDLSKLDDAERERLAPVAAAAEVVAAAEKALRAAEDDIGAAVERLDAAEKTEARFRKSPSEAFHALWKQNTSHPDKHR